MKRLGVCYDGNMFEGNNWFEYLDEPMRELVSLGFFLLEREEMTEETLSDYSFVVFPVAKAYEGFLKKLLFDLQLIDKDQLMGKSFRIGRSLNPNLPKALRDDEWLYEKMKVLSVSFGKEGERLPDRLWEAWSVGRNRVFHYFAREEKLTDLKSAKEKINVIANLMKEVVECSAEIRKQLKTNE